MALQMKMYYYEQYLFYRKLESKLSRKLQSISNDLVYLKECLEQIHVDFASNADSAVGLIKDTFDTKEDSVFRVECIDSATNIDGGYADATSKKSLITAKKEQFYALYEAEGIL